jgi:hypothetical protein
LLTSEQQFTGARVALRLSSEAAHGVPGAVVADAQFRREVVQERLSRQAVSYCVDI